MSVIRLSSINSRVVGLKESDAVVFLFRVFKCVIVLNEQKVHIARLNAVDRKKGEIERLPG